MRNPTKKSIKILFLLVSFLVVFCEKGKENQPDIMKSYSEQYKQKFEENASSVQIEPISPIHSRIVSSYQGPRMNSYTSIFRIQNQGDILVVYSYQCSFDNQCESSLDNLKIYDQNWREAKNGLIPKKELQEGLLTVNQQQGFQNPMILVDTFPDDFNRFVLQFSIADSASFDPTKGNISFVFGYLVWNPEKNGFDFVSEMVEPSP